MVELEVFRVIDPEGELEDRLLSFPERSRERSEELIRLGNKIYDGCSKELEEQYYGKLAVVIPASQGEDNKHRVISN